MDTHSAKDGTEKKTSIRTVATASAIGTTIEWYDFLIYATAASLVLNTLFFPTHDPLVGKLLSIGTIGVGFFARPLGAIICSHFGDRLGRRSMLILTLSSMGVATMLIGLLPTYESIGIAAPILLVVCRLIQGLAVGGEWGGAVLMVTEHAPPNKRGFYGSIVQIGFPLGMALGTASFFGLAYLSDEQFMAWGWRVPFLASALLVVVGTFIRMHIDETPEFKRNAREGKLVRFPVIDAIKNHPKDLLLGLGARITEISWIYVITIFGLSYAVTNLGISRNLVLGAIALGAAVELITIPLFGAISDRLGRRPVYMLGCVAAIALAFPIFWGIETRDPVTVILSFVIGMSVGHGIMYGVQASFLSEMFPSNLRYSGASLGYQLAAPIGGGLVPVAAAALVGLSAGSTWTVSLLMIAIAAVTMLAIYYAKETAPGVVAAKNANASQDKAMPLMKKVTH
ncbi:MFS transporter [Pusillimonas noertemannii]|uniref:MHS family shikimate/dehydroshikimate transporter-like MFS transporter n=1 Tax=Pusillimonas noertemannii TaxID=305977 RepID=A0A2U1CQD2_9BURK|nr:MFS transporter [Pusillimonas noertemannii]NYT67348.1 MHS family MFS transporter [Pusillimonas noertemannii]PVY68021.1 MHS family shikimate/dehydroshikimate transporter-like MFS transporter [Pusillimonas noertemannii]TFL12467.1 MFS transporter [Pusillimonas noertemannii]